MVVDRSDDSVWPMVEPLLEPLEQLAANGLVGRSVRDGARDLAEAIGSRGSPKTQQQQQRECGADAFEKAWKEANDPLIPVRGHGILALSKLVQQRHRHTLEHKQALMEMLQQALKHPDSYVYLMAIQALASLADVDTEPVLAILAAQMQQLSEHQVAIALYLMDIWMILSEIVLVVFSCTL